MTKKTINPYKYEYSYICKACGYNTKVFSSPNFISQNTSSDFCPQCNKTVEVKISFRLISNDTNNNSQK